MPKFSLLLKIAHITRDRCKIICEWYFKDQKGRLSLACTNWLKCSLLEKLTLNCCLQFEFRWLFWFLVENKQPTSNFVFHNSSQNTLYDHEKFLPSWNTQKIQAKISKSFSPEITENQKIDWLTEVYKGEVGLAITMLFTPQIYKDYRDDTCHSK